MSLALQRADWFKEDFDSQFRWYLARAGEEVAERYFMAVEATLEALRQHPDLGRLRRFAHPKLRGLRSFRVGPPFNKHLIFYRHDEIALYAERMLHGARDLSRRLVEPPGADVKAVDA